MGRHIPLKRIGPAEFRIDYDQAIKHVSSRSYSRKRDMAASKRWEMESGGVLPYGPIDLDEDQCSMIHRSLQEAHCDRQNNQKDNSS